jgi:hypothetical protein
MAVGRPKALLLYPAGPGTSVEMISCVAKIDAPAGRSRPSAEYCTPRLEA